MKTKLILGSLVAFVTMGTSQVYTPGGIIQGSSGNINVGIGTSSPAYPLDIHTNTGGGQGIRIKNNGNGWGGEATLRLDAVSVGGREYGIHSIGTGWGTAGSPGSLIIRDETAVAPRITIEGGTGNVGVGTHNPNNARLHSFLTTPPGSFLRYSAVKGEINSNGTNQSPSTGYYKIIGVEGLANGVACKEDAIGVSGLGRDGRNNYGGWFTATGSGSCQYSWNVGIYCEASGNTTNWAGYFVGDVFAYTYQGSDRKLKTNIKPLENMMDKIMKLSPSLYNYKTEEFKSMNLPQGNQMGLIAQDLEKVFPELIKEVKEHTQVAENGETIVLNPDFKSVNYTGLIPVLIAGMQEQQLQIEELKKQLAAQHSANLPKAINATGVSELGGTLSSFEMSQNEPNPFTHETVVKYTIPETVSSAYMAVYDLTGKQITTLPIDQKGTSSLTITSQKLPAGIYIYSIVADGKAIDSKRMIVAEK